MKTLTKTALLIMLSVAVLPANAQFKGLKKLGKKIKNKVEKSEAKTADQETESNTTSPWKSHDEIAEQNKQAEAKNQGTQRKEGDPTDEDLRKMKENAEYVVQQIKFIYQPVKDPNDGKIYTCLMGEITKKVPIDNRQGLVNNLVNARDAIEIIDHFKYPDITQKELQKMRTEVAELIEGHNNAVEYAKKEEYESNTWKSKSSPAPRQAEAKARVKKYIYDTFNGKYEILDYIFEDQWSHNKKERGLKILVTESLSTNLLCYYKEKDQYITLYLGVNDFYYLSHPNDKEKKVGINDRFTRVIDKKQVPRKFWR